MVYYRYHNSSLFFNPKPDQSSPLILLSGIYNLCNFEPPHSWGYKITQRDTPQSVGLLWKSDQLVAETSTRQHTQHLQQTNIHAPGGIRTRNPSSRSSADPRLRRLRHWDRQSRPLSPEYPVQYKIPVFNYIFEKSLSLKLPHHNPICMSPFPQTCHICRQYQSSWFITQIMFGPYYCSLSSPLFCLLH
jgi:hypothetical protein